MYQVLRALTITGCERIHESAGMYKASLHGSSPAPHKSFSSSRSSCLQTLKDNIIIMPEGRLLYPASDLTLSVVSPHTSFQKESKEHKTMQKELDAANERFKEYERKDVKLREDIKHLSAKHRKLTEKLAKDTVKAEVRPDPSLPVAFVLLQNQAAAKALCVNGAGKAIVPHQGPPACMMFAGVHMLCWAETWYHAGAGEGCFGYGSRRAQAGSQGGAVDPAAAA